MKRSQKIIKQKVSISPALPKNLEAIFCVVP